MPLRLDEVLRDHWHGFARRHAARLTVVGLSLNHAAHALRAGATSRLDQVCQQASWLLDRRRAVVGLSLSHDRRNKLVRLPAKPEFLIHGTPLAIRFRNRLELALKTNHPHLHDRLMEQHPEVFRCKWVADVRHTGCGKPALRYLAKYVFRSALGPKRLLGYDKSGNILLQCFESGTNRPHVIALSVDTFLKRWLTHVLPTRFVRVRHHGWIKCASKHPACWMGNARQ